MNDPRSRDDADPQRRRELLSDLVDGHCRPAAADEVLRAWKTDDRWRRDWHVYHLIGDVLRSDELAAGDLRHEAFVSALRARLSSEPVPMAPAPLPREAARPRHWMSSAAAVAGFAVVGASVFMLRPQDPGAASGWSQAQTAVVEPGSAAQRVSTGPAAPAASQVLVIDGQVIRDARLDAFFEAHRGALGPLPPALPGGALRSVEILVPQR